MIKLENFSKDYKNNKASKNKAVENISFEVKPFSITGLLGPNGAGKTTIIKAICSMHYPTEGNVYVYDKSGNCFNTETEGEKSKKLIGYVSENPKLLKNYTVIEYLKMICSIWNIAVEKQDEEIKKVVQEFKLTEVLSQKISTLSKGYCQRINFAAALIHDPEILILDEPSSGLDPAQINETRKLIKKLSKSKTILLSTHIMQEAELLCDQVVIISKGKLLASGDIESVKKSAGAKNLEDAFINLTKDSK